MRKIAVFVPDFFWSSIPYEGLTMWEHLRRNMTNAKIDLVMFSKDIRLNKVFTGKEKYKFDPQLFKDASPRIVKDWKELFAASAEYDLLVSQTHLFPKIRQPMFLYPEEFPVLKEAFKCPTMIWDIGGTDIFNARTFATFLCVKGPIWKDWFVKCEFPAKNIFVTGTPHYDYYHSADQIWPRQARPISFGQFKEKYEIAENRIVLIAPSNPGSHKEQFEENLKLIGGLVSRARRSSWKLLIKTYPNDYLFYDESPVYSGVYHRIYKTDNPQYQSKPQYEYLAMAVPKASIIESQDHFTAVTHSDKLYNMSGSHIAWETYFTKCQACAMNYKDKPYYGGASYLPEGVVLPDDQVNLHVTNFDAILGNKTTPKKCAKYFLSEFAHENIRKAIEKVT